MKKEICFVIMGFGKKTDYESGKSLDLDKTYKNIIKPSVINAGLTCIRADEIQDSNLIDKSMYAFLLQADLVIADISTYNPNTIYELGIRHGVRPFSTVILKEKGGKIPFDLDHTRLFTYNHLGEDIGKDESDRCVKELTELLLKIKETKNIDSPLYEYLQNVNPPELSKDEFEDIVRDLAEKEKHIFAIMEQAKKSMEISDFASAAKLWEKALTMIPQEPYFIQQLALSTYKSKEPSVGVALIDALNIIGELPETNDPETLGIKGAIYKNLYFHDKDIENLNRAIEYYGKGFMVRNDYYTGENYALCLNIKSQIIDDSEEIIYLKYEAKKSRENILKSLEKNIEDDDFENRIDKKWIYASLANCCFALGLDIKAKEYEDKFQLIAISWEKETYGNNKEILFRLTR